MIAAASRDPQRDRRLALKLAILLITALACAQGEAAVCSRLCVCR